MWVFSLLLACQNEETISAPQGLQVAGTQFEIIPDASVEEYVHAKYKFLLEQYGPARIAGKGFLVDEGWCHDYFHYAYTASRLLNLDFVKVASIQSREGIQGVNVVIDRAPRKHAKHDELRRIRTLINLTDDQEVSRSHALFRSFRDPNLSDQEQINAWLDSFREGFELRSGPSAPEEFSQQDFPLAYDLSEMAIVDFQTMAFIQSKGGVPAFTLLMRTIPFWNKRDECFELINSAG